MMRDGIIENAADARWIIATGKPDDAEALAFVAGLTPVALWYAYEIARCPSNDDIKVDRDGYLVIALNDDANPPGWYHYRCREDSEDKARAYILEKCGDVVSIPIRAMLSDKTVGDR